MRFILLMVMVGCAWLAACDGGSTSNPTPHPGPQETVFDDYFGERASSADSTTGSMADVGPPSDDTGGFSGSPDADGDGVQVMSCGSPFAVEVGASAVCQPLCDKLASCGGLTSDAAMACGQDCAATLAGIDTAAAAQIFDCYTGASCDALAAHETASGSDGGAAEGADSDGIQACVRGVIEAWGDASLDADETAICDASLAKERFCSGTTSDDEPAEDEEGRRACNAGATLLSRQALDAVAACDALDCSERETCLRDVADCLPFMSAIAFKDQGASATESTQPPP